MFDVYKAQKTITTLEHYLPRPAFEVMTFGPTLLAMSDQHGTTWHSRQHIKLTFSDLWIQVRKPSRSSN